MRRGRPARCERRRLQHAGSVGPEVSGPRRRTARRGSTAGTGLRGRVLQPVAMPGGGVPGVCLSSERRARLSWGERAVTSGGGAVTMDPTGSEKSGGKKRATRGRVLPGRSVRPRAALHCARGGGRHGVGDRRLWRRRVVGWWWRWLGRPDRDRADRRPDRLHEGDRQPVHPWGQHRGEAVRSHRRPAGEVRRRGRQEASAPRPRPRPRSSSRPRTRPWPSSGWRPASARAG